MTVEGGVTSVDELVALVHHATGSVSFADATKHCLLNTATPVRVADADLTQFYDKVFIP